MVEFVDDGFLSGLLWCSRDVHQLHGADYIPAKLQRHVYDHRSGDMGRQCNHRLQRSNYMGWLNAE